MEAGEGGEGVDGEGEGVLVIYVIVIVCVCVWDGMGDCQSDLMCGGVF